MLLGKGIDFDFGRVNFDILTSDQMRPEHRSAMKKVMGETLSHMDIIGLLSDPDVKCHVDSCLRPVSQKEAAIRVSRAGREYCSFPLARNGKSTMGLQLARALALTGVLMEFMEAVLRGVGIDCMIEARTDFNRFDSLAALHPDGRVQLFLDVSAVYPRARDDNELTALLMSGADDLGFVSVWMSLFHMAVHAVQLDRFYKGGLDDAYAGMKERFLAGCEDPAYYMASYPENLMCIEAELEAMQKTAMLLTQIRRDIPATALVLDYLNYKAMWYNTEYFVLPVQGWIPDYSYALTGLATKMFKTAEWYRTEPRHDREVSEEDRKAMGWDAPGDHM